MNRSILGILGLLLCSWGMCAGARADATCPRVADEKVKELSGSEPHPASSPSSASSVKASNAASSVEQGTPSSKK